MTDPKPPPADACVPVSVERRAHDPVSAGQRRINLIWELTQAFIALAVVLSNMIVAVYDGLHLPSQRAEFPVILSSSMFLIVGFYFARTNHSSIGGIGRKPLMPYIGR